MPSLYIDRANLSLETSAKTVEVRRGDALIARYPLALLDHLVVLAHCHIDSRLVLAMSEQGGAISVIDTRSDRSAILLEGRSVSARRRRAQADLLSDPSRRISWAGRLVAAKLHRQIRVLRSGVIARPIQRFWLEDAARRIEEFRSRLPETHDIAGLTGLEGAAAAAYFGAFTRLFAPSLEFTGRNRRPPRDPVNACLSFAYTLATAEGVVAIRRAGLDPSIGFLHEEAPGRPSLACDLVELLRSSLDWMVFECFRDGVLRAAHFKRTGAACMLGKAGRAVFLERYGSLEAWRRRLLHSTVRLLASTLVPAEAADAVLQLPVDPQSND